MSQSYVLPVGSNSVSTNLLTNAYNSLEALRSSFSGATAPTNPSPVAGQLYWDTVNSKLKIYDGFDWDSSIPRLDDTETITGNWVFNSLLQIPAGLKVNNTTADFDLADGRDTYIDSGESSIFVSQAGAGDFGSEAGHLIIQPRMVGGGVYRDIIFAGGNTIADTLLRITGEGIIYFPSSTQKLGLGTDGPDTTLHVYRGDSGATSHTAASATFEDDTEHYIQMLAPKANSQGILFGNPTDGNADGQFWYDNNLRKFAFSAGGVTALSINSAGQLVSTLTGSSPFVLTGVRTPASASAPGTLGEVCRDTNYVYVCTATDTWKRAALNSW